MQLIAIQLHDIGFRYLHASGLKQKHVQALVAHWQSTQISDDVIKNRMAVSAGGRKKPIVHLLSPKTTVCMELVADNWWVAIHDKSVPLNQAKLDTIQGSYVRASLLLQHHFGLRCEEAIKFQPTYADQGNYLRLWVESVI